MAGMSTALTEFSNNGNSRTSTYTGHTALSPKVVIEKRKLPENGSKIIEQSVKVVAATADADTIVLPQKVTFEAIIRYPVNGQASDVSAALAVFRDLVASDEFTNTTNTQEYL
jgi:hypothetical protein